MVLCVGVYTPKNPLKNKKKKIKKKIKILKNSRIYLLGLPKNIFYLTFMVFVGVLTHPQHLLIR